jgi:AAA+ ATPase superfamily predicted ATPase
VKFVNRQRELQALDHFYTFHKSALMILYGRRRVGKTSLLSYWLNQRDIPNALFWTATTHSAVYQLRDFSQALTRFDPRFTAPPADDFAFRDWEAALSHVAEIADLSPTPLVVIVDEFTHLLRSDPALSSVLQIAWDHRLSQLPNLRLVLTGSLVGLMERDVLSGRAPLYGRATSLLRLRPLSFGTLKEIFPDWPPAERVAAYAVCGGVPAYLDLFATSSGFAEGLGRCLTPGSVMLTDPALLLHDQLHEPYVYESVLAAIANGFHTWSEIAKMAGVAEGSLGFYLKTLQALELVERRDPVLSSPTSRRSRYYVRDPFLRFYYRFIIRHITAIERDDVGQIIRAMSEELRAFIGTYVFEELCREWVYAEADSGALGFSPEAVGSFWTRRRGQAVQLEVVAASPRDKRLFIGEAKWGAGNVERNVLTDLVARSQRMPQTVEPGWRVQYGLFAREGFTDATVRAAKEMGARLVDLSELEDRLTEAALRAPALPSGEIEF